MKITNTSKSAIQLKAGVNIPAGGSYITDDKDIIKNKTVNLWAEKGILLVEDDKKKDEKEPSETKKKDDKKKD